VIEELASVNSKVIKKHPMREINYAWENPKHPRLGELTAVIVDGRAYSINLLEGENDHELSEKSVFKTVLFTITENCISLHDAYLKKKE